MICLKGHRMKSYVYGMLIKDERSHGKTPMMTKDEEVDEEWILSPHAPQSTNPL